MRAEEFLNEAHIDLEINKILKTKGYTKLGSGADQNAYLAPDGAVLKIFGTSRYNDGSMELSKGQRAFKAFADYCLAHTNNPFLPQFSGWETFAFKGRPYLQIKVERLFPFNVNKTWPYILAAIADKAERTKSPEAKEDFIDLYINSEYVHRISREAAQQLFMHLGDDGFNLLWDTIYDLMQVARSIGLRNLDLHAGNFMLGEDGQIVIADPFYAGEF